jgi:hypothetical protein
MSLVWSNLAGSAIAVALFSEVEFGSRKKARLEGRPDRSGETVK